MEREQIFLVEHLCRSLIDENYEEHNEEEILDFDYIEDDVIYTDLEKSYQTKHCIIRRKSDSKYFKFSYYDSTYRSLFEDIMFPIKAEEVFPTIITKTIYT
jgi:hypothetical protein